MATILVTGGCGFIGSHQAVSLLEAGHDVVIVDNLSNSRAEVIDHIGELAGRAPTLEVLDVRQTDELAKLMIRTNCEMIIHFAGMKHVAESMELPIDYFDANVGGLTSLLRASEQAGVKRLIFSSSGSVYGPATKFPISEDAPTQPTNPYSTSKLVCERILSSVCAADPSWSVVALRYFNPAGAHPSGLIGEDPTHLVTNLLPVIMDTARGGRPAVPILGEDLPTKDGTAVRDYVHVMDVAEAHQRALPLLDKQGFDVFNIGRGEGDSVRELIAAAERAIGDSIPVTIGVPRPGDVPALYADTTLAEKRIGSWDYRDLDEICRDAWRFWSKS